jgi:hypothetical protein
MELQRCYDVLGIKAEASPETVRQAYKTQVKFFHPDRFTDDPDQRQIAEKRLKEVNAAYAALQTYQAGEPRKHTRTEAPASESPAENYARPSGAAENSPPAAAGPKGTSLLHHLQAIGERVATGISKALQNMREHQLTGQPRNIPRRTGGCRRGATGPRRAGRRMGRGGGCGGGRRP